MGMFLNVLLCLMVCFAAGYVCRDMLQDIKELGKQEIEIKKAAN